MWQLYSEWRLFSQFRIAVQAVDSGGDNEHKIGKSVLKAEALVAEGQFNTNFGARE